MHILFTLVAVLFFVSEAQAIPVQREPAVLEIATNKRINTVKLADYSRFIGTYRGPATVLAMGVESHGYVEFKVVSITESGRVNLKVRGYNGFAGIGTASGQLSSSNTVNFSGKLAFTGSSVWDLDGSIQFAPTGNKMNGRYDLIYTLGSSTAIQEGRFEAEKRF